MMAASVLSTSLHEESSLDDGRYGEPEMELVIDMSGDMPTASGHFVPRRPRDLELFAADKAGGGLEGLDFELLQDELRVLEEETAAREAEAIAAARRRRVKPANPTQPKSSSAALTSGGDKPQQKPAARQAPLPQGSDSAGRARKLAPKPVAVVAVPPKAQNEPSEPDEPEIRVECEDPLCSEVLVVRPRGRGRGPTEVPPGNWFCARHSAEARERGIKLFERVLQTRTLGGRTSYLVKYWERPEEEAEWLDHADMQSLEVSCSGV